MSAREILIHLPSGGVARVSLTDGDKTTIVTPESSPPGSLVRGRIDGVSTEFQLKVRNCKKDGEHFVIDGRMKNATREIKAWLRGETPEPT